MPLRLNFHGGPGLAPAYEDGAQGELGARQRPNVHVASKLNSRSPGRDQSCKEFPAAFGRPNGRPIRRAALPVYMKAAIQV